MGMSSYVWMDLIRKLIMTAFGRCHRAQTNCTALINIYYDEWKEGLRKGCCRRVGKIITSEGDIRNSFRAMTNWFMLSVCAVTLRNCFSSRYRWLLLFNVHQIAKERKRIGDEKVHKRLSFEIRNFILLSGMFDEKHRRRRRWRVEWVPNKQLNPP